MIQPHKLQEIELAYYISPDGVEYPLFGGKQRVLMSFDGLGMPDINYITDSGPFINGARVRDFRLSERVIDFFLRERGCSRDERWNNIGDLIATIRMNRGGAGRILVVLPDGTQREIDAWIQDGPSGRYDASGALSPYDLAESLRFLAPYPIWRDPDAENESITIMAAGSCLDTCLPTCLGDGAINPYITITYPGTFETYPTIFIFGPAVNPIIRNMITDKEIDLKYSVAAGEIVTIDLTPYQATITNNFGTDLIGTASDLDSLGTFAIEPESVDVPGGVNLIQFICAGAVAPATRAIIQYNDNYLGVPR